MEFFLKSRLFLSIEFGMDSAPQILVVDDELAVIVAVQQILHNDEAVFAINLQEGRALWEKHQQIKLVITDFSLPDGLGTDLATQVLHQCPDVKVILISGFALECALAANDSPRMLVLEKPFSARQLRD